jgi:hypothetical protein
MKKMTHIHLKGQKRGQSFVELMLIVLILALLLAGVVEFGFMMNNYLHVLDAAREAARYTSSSSPFTINADGSIANFYDPKFYYVTALKAGQTIMPILLHAENEDDIVVSVFSVGGGYPVRFPDGMSNGWSLCTHYDDFIAYLNDPDGNGDTSDEIPVPDALSAPNYSSTCTAQPSKFSSADVNAKVNLANGAPPTGVLVVEIFYNYPQLLKLPVFTSVLPDPIPVYVYSVMPSSAAEPTPTPIH